MKALRSELSIRLFLQSPFAVSDSPFTNVPACRPLFQPLLPVSATGGGHRRCPHHPPVVTKACVPDWEDALVFELKYVQEAAKRGFDARHHRRYRAFR